ncbi:hypothetical protein DPMN_025397 [Dreissena polymorpha]|uniref:Uncharacterized protein n=1 Tax=Dreissena polymorpha TaxID=45954 RepID=A0A9D4LP83_DREPO|nr:hypothetical protein DPMN_025397 [Dreissena polymorpha]
MAILDLFKAFYTVQHKKLLHKLDHNDVNSYINHWLEEFLSDTSMKDVVEGEKSNPETVDSSVP